MLFLAQGEITRTKYMGGSETESVTRLVEADDERNAREKFIHHYESQTCKYDVYVRVDSVEISPTIV